MNDLQAVSLTLSHNYRQRQNQTVVWNYCVAQSALSTKSLIHYHDFCAKAKRLWYKIYQETSSARITLHDTTRILSKQFDSAFGLQIGF